MPYPVEDHCSALAVVLEYGRSGETGGNQWTNFDLVNFICDRMDDKLNTQGSSRRSLIRLSRIVPDMISAMRHGYLQDSLVGSQRNPSKQALVTLSTGILRTKRG